MTLHCRLGYLTIGTQRRLAPLGFYAVFFLWTKAFCAHTISRYRLLEEFIMTKRKVKKASQVCILTVTGKDKVGIIARIAVAMSKANINIIDVSQKIMDEYFVMSLACDIADAIIDLPNIQKQLQKIAKDMDLNITFQHENIFKMMHRV
jgi:ACT domain-containing protein